MLTEKEINEIIDRFSDWTRHDAKKLGKQATFAASLVGFIESIKAPPIRPPSKRPNPHEFCRGSEGAQSVILGAIKTFIKENQ